MPTSVELANGLVSAAGSGDAADAALVAGRVAVFPETVLSRLQRNRTRVRACRNSITDHLVSLQGQLPRGWPPGSTWDMVPGIFNPSTNEVVIAVIGHGTVAGLTFRSREREKALPIWLCMKRPTAWTWVAGHRFYLPARLLTLPVICV